MSAFSTQGRGRRAISATEAEIVALLDRLDEQESDGNAAASKPKGELFDYRVDSCEVSLQHIGATNEVTFVVPTRNMSAEGMTFLYSGFAHIGSRCRLSLLTNNGSTAIVNAAVTNCRYVENWMHEITVEFDAKIHAASFCPPSPEWSALVVVPDDDQFRQVRHYLTVLRADVKRAEDGGEAITMVSKEAFDCVLFELAPLGQGAIDAVTAIRGNGYAGVILGIFSERDANVDKVMSAGCSECLEKPYRPELMKAIYNTVRGSAPTNG